MKTDFGTRMRKLRNERSMTQSDLALQLEKSSSTVRMWELGGNEPDMNSLIKMSNIFDCSLDYLMCRDLSSPDGGMIKTNVAVYELSEYSPEAETLRYMSLPSRFVKDGNSYAMIVCDSEDMAPVISREDTVLVRKQDSCMNGQIALVSIEENKSCFRKLLFQSGGLMMQPVNPAAEPRFVGFDEFNETNPAIYGIAVELIRDFL